MSQRNSSRLLSAAAIAFLVVFGYAGYAVAQQSHLLVLAPPPAQPIKLDIRPTAQVYHVGQQVTMDVTLRDTNNHVVPSEGKTVIEVSNTDPAGHTSKTQVNFKSGEKLEHYHFTANQRGLYRITASQANLRSGSYAVLVSGTPPPGTQGFRLTHGIRRAGITRLGKLLMVALRGGSRESPSATGGNAQPPGSPQLMLLVNDVDHEFLADGMDPVKIQVFYINPTGGVAPTDISVVLTSSNGVLKPDPLVIHKGLTWAVTNLRCSSPADAHVRIVSSSPAYAIAEPTEYTVNFGPPIYGVNAVVPKELALVDTGTVTAQLIGPGNNPVKTNKDIHVTITSNSPSVRLGLASKDIEIKKDTSAVSIPLIPQELGKAELQVSIPNRHPETYPVAVTGLTVILLCLAGGVIGGVCAFDAFKGSLSCRIFLGIVGGAVLTWMYVFVGLPHMSWSVAHNMVSAMFVAIVGGFMGLQVLNLAAKLLGFTNEKPTP